MGKTKRFSIFMGSTLLVGMLAACGDDEEQSADPVDEETNNETNESDSTSTFTVFGTTDIHAHLLPYDYMNDEEDSTIGLTKVYSLLEELREEYPNHMLADNGDTIQGSILGDMPAQIEPLADDESHIVMDAMNEMGYDAAALGNHEFNFGLDFLDETMEDADFPWLSANVVEPGTETPVYEPYTIVEQEVDGEVLNVGFIGFVPPQIMSWDAAHLEGEVETLEIADAAEKFVPQLQEEGADLVIALAHTGINDGDRMSENAALSIAEVDGVDGMLLGHQHNHFPSEDYEGVDGVDVDAGTIHGVPAMMPGSWGSHLGVLAFELENANGEWNVVSATSEIQSTEDQPSHEGLENLVMDAHEATVSYVNSPVGEITDDIHTFFARVEDNEVVQLINDAQLDYMEQMQASGELEEDVPLLSAAAPFRAGRGGDFTYVEEGDVAIRDMNDVYVFPNTLHVVEVDGDQLKNWLEYSALNFNQIDPDENNEQALINEDFASYNFDVIENVTYEIDVTQDEGERIVDLQHEGEDVTSDDRFYVATNNYRAGGEDHLDSSVETVLETTDENRQVIIDYIVNHDGALNVERSNNWQITPFESAGEVIFETALEAQDASDDHERIEFIEEDGDGATFSFN
ncbi:bifunctional 2',3'-cyclic-nucleotide 2'-phosphodiesterase/3'-nucleotidase [Geomicrobium sp. JCM 19055]|uniref:bifunctional 2',3'-cyclic-nucleotide 2'-phosphodiesterase/3'-nucleotidase n=1 Tax=Geomicrobium sp. JCM 19055 TaxID=1460649 RepID=UPI00045ED350|nr:bifunctional 2',3'-cyclic-nucleotide 2'-phosphodiesterase/3'-nucleotidase [Geomicrobium sp. JCM 19055]GAJ98179.1 2',3'-cyclic-nucleotide 2'-phosphodiesterase [Geomicrobium sp. JCM 19055]